MMSVDEAEQDRRRKLQAWTDCDCPHCDTFDARYELDKCKAYRAHQAAIAACSRARAALEEAGQLDLFSEMGGEP